MNRFRFILKSLAHYRRTHLGVVAGTAVGAAVLTGALIVGDSVRHTLHEQALSRIGQVELALHANDRFFHASLARRLADSIDPARVAPLLQMRGIASTFNGERTARKVNVLGVDARFFDMAPTSSNVSLLDEGDILINERLARQLNASVGDEIVLRVETPSALPRDTALGTVEDISLALRVNVAGIAGEEAFGRFSLQADQIPPFNAFLSLEWLQEQLDIPDRANVLLVDSDNAIPQATTVDEAIREVFELRDAQLDFLEIPDSADGELRSGRIFIEPIVEDALADSDHSLKGILTYFVNAIEFGDRSTPYSMVTAVGSLDEDRSATIDPAIPIDLADDEIVINEWLAEDLGCTPGDTIQLRYFILDENDRLAEVANAFSVRAIIPMTGLAGDRSLMPDFPGIADAESSRDWQPGIPIDLGLIRDKDEAYWDTHRGTPKAFVTLPEGRRMWGNRYGALTAVRFSQHDTPAIRESLRNSIDPTSLGLFMSNVRTPALDASRSTTDFGGLFLALSFFLIFAALLLTALLFVFNIEQRAREIGTLLAVGFRPNQVGRLLMAEGFVLAIVGSLAGTLIGVVYTRIILAALAGVWSQAIASASIELHVKPMTLLIGAAASIIAAAMAMRLTLGRSVRREPVVLLGGAASTELHSTIAARTPFISIVLAASSIVGAIVIALAVDANHRSASMAFFGAGSLLLIGGMAISRILFLRLRRTSTRLQTSVGSLAIRNSSRRIGRSLATVSLLACGVFLVVAVAANRLDSLRTPDLRSSGTGGFALIGESTLPVLHDLNDQRGRDAFGLTAEELQGVTFIPMRIRDGDDASCLNLNLAQNPRLMGVDPTDLASREAFRFVRYADEAGGEPSWNLLGATLADGVVPAIADDASVTWAMHKSVGDTLSYTDEQGRTFQVMIVGTIANSILQGNLLIDEKRFREHYPSEPGHRAFLIDAPDADRSSLETRLQRALSDVGLELMPASSRLDDFNAVQNTYLSIFQLLGGLGLLLGSIGLGIVVVRNVLERRNELALLRALGFNLQATRRLVRNEHVFVLGLGLLWGTIAAFIAVLPAMRSATAEFPMRFTVIILALLVVNGLFWVWLATRFAVSGELTNALCEE